LVSKRTSTLGMLVTNSRKNFTNSSEEVWNRRIPSKMEIKLVDKNNAENKDY
jgi:hypothetical protein